MLNRKFNALPGFGLTMGFTLVYLSAIVLIPMAALFLKTFQLSWSQFWDVVTSERAMAAYRLTFGASLVAALVNAIFGTVLAWVLVRYTFPGRKFIDALVDFPFALPTAVAGLTLADLLSDNGWLGRYLKIWNESSAREAVAQQYQMIFQKLADIDVLGIVVKFVFPQQFDFAIHAAFSQLGVVIALTFVGMPFAVRTLQPVLEALDRGTEEAAATLGAGRWQALKRVVFPELLPALLTGFALAFARAVGEYGSVIFISGNMPMRTEITPLLIVTKLSQYDYAGATALAVATLMMSFVLLFLINLSNGGAGQDTREPYGN